MNPTSLQALIIDRHFGELSPEAAELLALHLTQNAEARAEAERVLQSLATTHRAVLQHPELVVGVPLEKTTSLPPKVLPRTPWLARAAALIVFAMIAATAGFMAGRSSPPPAVASQRSPTSPATNSSYRTSPWARYRLAFNPKDNGMQVVRVDTVTTQK